MENGDALPWPIGVAPVVFGKDGPRPRPSCPGSLAENGEDPLPSDSSCTPVRTRCNAAESHERCALPEGVLRGGRTGEPSERRRCAAAGEPTGDATDGGTAPPRPARPPGPPERPVVTAVGLGGLGGLDSDPLRSGDDVLSGLGGSPSRGEGVAALPVGGAVAVARRSVSSEAAGLEAAHSVAGGAASAGGGAASVGGGAAGAAARASCRVSLVRPTR